MPRRDIWFIRIGPMPFCLQVGTGDDGSGYQGYVMLVVWKMSMQLSSKWYH